MNLKSFFSWLDNHKILLFILLLGLTPLIWFKNNLYLIYGDIVFQIYKLELNDLLSNLYLWSSHSYAGNLNLYVAKTMPLLSFWTILREMGFSFINTEKLWFIFIFVLPGLTMYYLMSVITKKEEIIPKIISPLFYMFNPFVLVHSTTMQWGTLLVYGVSPLLLGFFIKGSKSQKQVKYAILIGLSSLIFASAGVNLVTYTVAWMPIVFYILYDMLNQRKTRILLFIGKVIIVTFLLNLFWIIPYVIFFSDSSPYTTTLASVDVTHHLKWSSEYSNLGYLFRLLGKWGWLKGSQGSFYYPYHPVYENQLFIFTLFIPIILILWSTLNKVIKREHIFFFLLLLTGLFLAKGTNPPLGEIYLFLFKTFPGFWVFRESFPRFMPMVVLSYSVLLGISTQIIIRTIPQLNLNLNIQKNIRIISIPIIMIIILLNAWPLITGDVVPDRKGALPGSETLIPPYWFEASNYINALYTSNDIFILPRSLPYQGYMWNNSPYYGQDITPYIIKKPHLSLNSGGGYTRPVYTHNLMKHLYAGIEIGNINNIAKILGILKVQYILQRNDLDWTHFGTKDDGSPEHIKTYLNNQEGISLKNSFGELDLYEIDKKYILPQIHFATKSVLIDDPFTINRLDSFLSEEFDPYGLIFFSDIYPRANNTYNIYKKVNFIASSNYTYTFSTSYGIYDIYLKIPEKFIKDIKEIEVDGEKANITFGNNKTWIKNILLNNGFHNITLVTQSKYLKFQDDFSDTKNRKYWTGVSGTWKINNDAYFSNGTWNKIYVQNSTHFNLSNLGNIKEMYRTQSKTKSNNLHGLIMSYSNNSYYLVFLRSSTESLHFRRYENGELVRDVSQYYPNTNNTWYDITVKRNSTQFEIFINKELQMTATDDILNNGYFGIVSYGDAEFDIVSYMELDLNNDFFELKEINIEKVRPETYEKPFITFKKINPTKYNVRIENATQPFYLVFSDSFHPQWKAYKDTDFACEEIEYYNNTNVKECRHEMSFTPKDVSYILKEPLPEDNHFTANGFANSWYIDPKEIDKDGDGNFTVTLYFKPQSYFYLGLAISITTIILCILYLIYDWRKRNTKTVTDPKKEFKYEFKPKKQKYSYKPR